MKDTWEMGLAFGCRRLVCEVGEITGITRHGEGMARKAFELKGIQEDGVVEDGMLSFYSCLLFFHHRCLVLSKTCVFGIITLANGNLRSDYPPPF